MLRLMVALILFALILIFSTFAVINRAFVVVHFDFWNLLLDVQSIENNPFVFQVPLFIIAFVAGLLGMIIGALLPALGFVRKKRLAYQKKINQPIQAPPPLEPTPPHKPS